MTYVEFRDSIADELRRTRAGLTWAQLQQRLALPYDRPCPTWTKQLEHDIGLARVKGQGRALVWKVASSRPPRKAQGLPSLGPVL
jgi:hypothetical protein